MKRVLLLLIGVLAIATESLGQDRAYLQVSAPEGVSIVVDDISLGVSDGSDLYAPPLNPGVHVIRASKPGFSTQTQEVRLGPGQVFRFTVSEFDPVPQVSQRGDNASSRIKREVGILVVRTFPIDASISVPSIGVIRESKDRDQWRVSSVPAGEIEVRVSANGQTVSRDLEIKSDVVTELFVDFVSGDTRVTYNGLEPGFDFDCDPTSAVPVNGVLDCADEMPVLSPDSPTLEEIVRYPEAARRAGVEGRVYVRIVVNEDGGVSRAEVFRSPNDLLSEASVEAFRQLQFVPARHKGRVVRVRMIQYIHFRLR